MTKALDHRNLSFIQALLVLLLMATVPAWGQTNLITNGDFESGNTGFVSDYNYYNPPDVLLTQPGVYVVKRNPHDYHPQGFYDFHDHTGNNGKFFIANGFGSSSTAKVWSKTLTNVEPHTYYDFSFWATHLSNGNGQAYCRANFYVKINETTVINNFAPQFVSGQGYWSQSPVYRWYSGNLTQVTITIYDACAASSGYGDDFGIDDISFVKAYSNIVQPVDDAITTCFETTSANFNPMANDNISPSSIIQNVLFDIYTQPSHGTLQLVSGTTYRYIPNTGYSGTDTFTYRLRYGTNDITAYGTVTITVLARPQRTINMDACESYTWGYNGQTYTQTGQYSCIHSTPDACDSLIILNLTIHHDEEETLPAVEQCDSYTWHGQTYTQSGVYDYTTTTQWGCVLTQHLPLTIYYGDTVDYTVAACETYTWHGQTHTQSGLYTYNTTNDHGCSRLERLHLTISDRYHEIIPVEECEEYYWPRTGQTYTVSTLDSVQVNGPQGGCDSTFVLNLTIHYGDTITLDAVEACDSYEWHGQTYTTSGVKEYWTTNTYGCTRLERLPLTIYESENHELQGVTACDSYVWHGHTYTESGVAVFDTVNEHGCDVQYSLPLLINHSDTLDWEPVTECDSYVWYGQTITESGPYAHWSTNPEGCDRLERIYITINYSTVDTLAPVTACDSYEWHGEEYSQSGYFSYVGEGPSGCPHTEVLLLTINHSSEYEFNVTACESYTWYDSIYTEPGTYYHMLTNSQNCDSLLIMNLEIGEEFVHEESQIGCGSYEWHGEVYTEDGDYSYEVENPAGCDSLFILHLTIAPTYDEDMEAESCYSFTWIDQVYDESGDYERHFQSAMGCDSLVTLHLTIKDAVHYEFEQQTCLPFTWNDITYYENGDYEQTFEAHNGCDSIAVMHLVFSDAMTSEFERTSCGFIQWYEHLCDHDGNYVHTFESVQGCDSIVTMHFSLSENLEHEFDTLACESFEWYGNSCSESGVTYTHVFQTPQGCDSLVTMHLTLNVPQVFTQFRSACDSIELNGVMYNVPGSYYVYGDTVHTQNGCDSLIYRVNLTVTNSEQMGTIEGSHNVYVASNLISGIYRYDIDTTGIVSDIAWSISNPDWQIVERQATYCRVLVSTPGSGMLKASFRTATCGEMEKQFEINAGFFGVDENGVAVNVYPNPTKGTVTIESEGIESVRLTNMMGQTLTWNEYDRSDLVSLNLTGLKPSVYLIEIKTVNGTVKRKVVVKN